MRGGLRFRAVSGRFRILAEAVTAVGLGAERRPNSLTLKHFLLIA